MFLYVCAYFNTVEIKITKCDIADVQKIFLELSVHTAEWNVLEYLSAVF